MSHQDKTAQLLGYYSIEWFTCLLALYKQLPLTTTFRLTLCINHGFCDPCKYCRVVRHNSFEDQYLPEAQAHNIICIILCVILRKKEYHAGLLLLTSFIIVSHWSIWRKPPWASSTRLKPKWEHCQIYICRLHYDKNVLKQRLTVVNNRFERFSNLLCIIVVICSPIGANMIVQSKLLNVLIYYNINMYWQLPKHYQTCY